MRETRRFAGIKKLTADEVLAGLIPDDTIGLAGYKIDIHSGTDNTTLFRNVEEPYGIPYGTLVSSEIDNLMFAGRCASFDAATLASVRVMPHCMSMGQAAGIAASMAIDGNITPAEIDVKLLRDKLFRDGAVLTMEQVNTIGIND